MYVLVVSVYCITVTSDEYMWCMYHIKVLQMAHISYTSSSLSVNNVLVLKESLVQNT